MIIPAMDKGIKTFINPGEIDVVQAKHINAVKSI